AGCAPPLLVICRSHVPSRPADSSAARGENIARCLFVGCWSDTRPRPSCQGGSHRWVSAPHVRTAVSENSPGSALFPYRNQRCSESSRGVTATASKYFDLALHRSRDRARCSCRRRGEVESQPIPSGASAPRTGPPLPQDASLGLIRSVSHHAFYE